MTARLDELLPAWDHRDRHRIAVRAEPAAVMAAVEEVRFKDVPVFHLLMMVGTLGTKRSQGKKPFLGSMTDGGFTTLHRGGDEIVVGAAIRTEDPGKGPVDLGGDPAGAFRDYDGPGVYKVAFNFRHADGELSTETRVISTDDPTKRRFSRYWTVIRVPSGLIRMEWLRSIRQLAEKKDSTAPAP